MPNSLQEIFDAQTKLGNRFLIIEKENGLARGTDYIGEVNLHDFYNQQKIRGHAWRVTEECCELFRAYIDDKDKAPEELSDILHFLVEMSVLCGLKPHHLAEEDPMGYLFNGFGDPGEFFKCWNRFVVQLGMTINILNSRPWKTTLKPVNLVAFQIDLRMCWYRFAELAWSMEIGPVTLYSLYFDKHSKNVGRIESGV